MTDRYLRTSQVARLLKVSPVTILRWVREQKLPYLLTIGGHYRFPPETIERLSQRLRKESPVDSASVGSAPEQ
ncbi:MAG: MerR family transcriptional regulator [Actinomycetota bacterium]